MGPEHRAVSQHAAHAASRLVSVSFVRTLSVSVCRGLRRVGTVLTAYNWNTVCILDEKAKEDRPAPPALVVDVNAKRESSRCHCVTIKFSTLIKHERYSDHSH